MEEPPGLAEQLLKNLAEATVRPKHRSKRTKHSTDKKNEPEEKPFDVDDLPAALRRKPLFIFCEAVAGRMEMTDLNKMFNLKMLSQQKHTITSEALHHTVKSAFLKAETYVRNKCQQYSVFDVDCERGIVADPSHRCYDAFVALVCMYMRYSTGLKQQRSGSLRENFFIEMNSLEAEQQFDLALTRRPRY